MTATAKGYMAYRVDRGWNFDVPANVNPFTNIKVIDSYGDVFGCDLKGQFGTYAKLKFNGENFVIRTTNSLDSLTVIVLQYDE